jgi:tRNA pseudouridine55 synthase
MNGVLVIDKPAGMTSHDVVDEVRRRLGVRRVGHAGTLDPDATGVLVLGVGRATRLLSYPQASDKRYVTQARFGSATSTQDASGEVVFTGSPGVTRERLLDVLPEFTGVLRQVPPMFSAIKVEGERLYEKARRGEEVARAAREVTIHSIELVEFAPGDEPEAVLDVVCSTGTFVRTLVHDVGMRLGSGAHVVSLRRSASGGFDISDAVPLEDVAPDRLLPAVEAVRTLRHVTIGDSATGLVRDGRPLSVSVTGDTSEPREREPVALVSGDRLLAVYRRRDEQLVAERVMTE